MLSLRVWFCLQSILEREGGEEENREMAREAVQEMESQRKLAVSDI